MNIQKFKRSYEFIDPPGFYRTFLPGLDRSSCVAADIFDNHRFLFYSLCRDHKNSTPLNLVTIDYHQDLCAPSDDEKEDLNRLNLLDEKEVAYFCWNHLNPNNDGHILAAMFVNLIGNAVVLYKSGSHDEICFKDKDGREHKVYCYKEAKEVIVRVLTFSDNIHLDIDLDYFVDKKTDASGHEAIELVDGEIAYEVLTHSGELMKHLQGKLRSITIAKEPEHCGGVRNSNEIFQRVSEKLFVGDIWGAGHATEGLKIYSKII